MDVLLVDDRDNEIGREEKLSAHKKGLLHRAFSVFVFNSNKELLLQKRSASKYHSKGLWANTCCSHPLPGKELKDEAERRLFEELGIRCSLTEMFSFTYRTKVGGGLTEHEYDHVFFGKYEKDPTPAMSEVSETKWVSLTDLKSDLSKNPEKYAPWLQLCIDEVIEKAKMFSKG